MGKKKRHQRRTKGDRCGWCNGSGYFPDLDVDFGFGRFGVCAGCAATGRAIVLSGIERDRLLAYRFKRDSLGRRAAEIGMEFDFGEALLYGRTKTLEAIDEALGFLASVQTPSDTEIKHVRRCSRILDLLFWLNPREGYEALFNNAAERCECREHLSGLRVFAALVQTLPVAGTAEASRLAADFERLERGYLRDCIVSQKLGDLSVWLTKGKYEGVLLSHRLGRILAFGDGLQALREAGAFAASERGRLAYTALKSSDRATLNRDWAYVEPLAQIYARFKAGLGGSSSGRPEPFDQDFLDCPCQELRRAFESAREKVALLLPAEDIAEWERLRQAVTARQAKLEQMLYALKAELAKPILPDEFLLLSMAHYHWVEAGRPANCYAARLVETLIEASRPKRAMRSPRTADQLAAFGLLDAPAELEGLNAELLAELADVMSDFGTPDPQGVRRLSTDTPAEVHVVMSETSAAPAKFIIIGSGGVSGDEGMHVFRIGRSDQSKAVFWDRRVTAAAIRAIVEIANAVRRSHPQHEAPSGGTQIPTLQVDAVFAKRGSGMPVLPGGPDAETLRQQFDRPEEVMIATNPLGGTALHHQRDSAYLAFRERVAMAILQGHGIEDSAGLASISVERILELRKEIEAAVSAEFPS